MGPMQKRIPPVRPDDPLCPDPYSRSKIEAEALVTASGLNLCILGLAAVLPTVPDYSGLISTTRQLFEMPLDARCEIVLDLDVAHALVSAAENLPGSGGISGKRGFIAGGMAQGCQTTTRDLVGVLFGPLGFRFPDESLFTPELDSCYLDWHDTEQTRAILGCQRHSVGEWQAMIRKMVRPVLPVLPLFKAGITRWVERQSPRYPASTHRGGRAA
jgi:hypothetical protein